MLFRSVDVLMFNEVISRTWHNKKQTSPYICKNPTLVELDTKLKLDSRVLSHKLCGAGNGGYFLIFTDKGLEKDLSTDYSNIKQISISESGFNTVNLKI